MIKSILPTTSPPPASTEKNQTENIPSTVPSMDSSPCSDNKPFSQMTEDQKHRAAYQIVMTQFMCARRSACSLSGAIETKNWKGSLLRKP